MTDIVDAATRSRMMSGIRGTNTKPEILIRKLLHRRGFRFRINDSRLPGKPDIVLPKYHAVVFVNGCFWHGHDCRLFKMPSTRREFWQNKLEKNRKNDERSLKNLCSAGWRVATVWECAVRGPLRQEETALVERLVTWIWGNDEKLELAAEKHPL